MLQYFEQDFANKIFVLLHNNYFSNEKVMRGLIEALIESDHQSMAINGQRREVYHEASRFLNLYGGTHILDYYSADEIKKKVLNHLATMEGISYKQVSVFNSTPP